LTYSTEVTSNGGTVSLVSGTTSHGGQTTYTAVPSSEIPSPSTYKTSHGGTVTYSYIPTSHGYETVTYTREPTVSGGSVCKVTSETSNGGTTSFTETTNQITTSRGGTATQTSY